MAHAPETKYYCELLGTRDESGYHRMYVDRRIRFEYVTCGRGNILIRKEKVADSKIFRYVCTGRNSPTLSLSAQQAVKVLMVS